MKATENASPRGRRLAAAVLFGAGVALIAGGCLNRRARTRRIPAQDTYRHEGPHRLSWDRVPTTPESQIEVRDAGPVHVRPEDACRLCGGTGELKTVPCTVCGGTGIEPIHYREQACHHCGGTGNEPCYRCGGTGYLEKELRNWQD